MSVQGRIQGVGPVGQDPQNFKGKNIAHVHTNVPRFSP